MSLLKENTKKKWKQLGIAALVVSAITTTTVLSFASDFGPGSENDPLVTKSYVDELFSSITENQSESDSEISNISEIIDAKVEEAISNLNINEESSTNEDSSPAKELVATGINFQVEFVKAGQEVRMGEGGLFILRTGKGEAIAGDKGGLSDITAGVDLITGDNVERNHLMIVPRSDGRGVNILADAYIMVSGEYEIN